MSEVEFFVPPGHPMCELSFDMEISKMLAQLKHVDDMDVPVPNSGLSVRLLLRPDLALVIFKKGDQTLYVNIFCFESRYSAQALDLVKVFYINYDFGIPAIPTIANWIHAIPILEADVEVSELFFCQKMAISFYDLVNMQVQANLS
jgi:hypothetical protein